MPFTLRQFEQEDNFCQQISLDAFQQVIPPAQIEAALASCGPVGTRNRRLTPLVVVWLISAMHLFSHSSIAHVFPHLARGLRFLWPDPLSQLPGDAALSYRRYQLGAKPLLALFHAICRPMATLDTKGAFLFGLRLMAIDGTTEDAANTPENARADAAAPGTSWPRSLSSTPGDLPGRMWDARHRGCRVLAPSPL